MWKHYHTAGSISDALALLNDEPEHTRLIAGGTDILIELERGARTGIDTLIDISRIPDLNEIHAEPGRESGSAQRITIGALATHNDIVASGILRTHAPLLQQAAWEVGAPQIRNRATLAGNVITGSPANDTIVPLWVLNADIRLQSISGIRTVPIRTFYKGVRKTVMQPDEMLTAIEFDGLRTNQRGIFIKLGLRRAQAISVINIAVILTFDSQRGDLSFDPTIDPSTAVIADAAIALGCVAPTIVSAKSAEETLIGRTLTAETIRSAAQAAVTDIRPISDIRSTADYRLAMAEVLVMRALRSIQTGIERASLPDNPAMLWGVTPTQPAPIGTIRDQHEKPIRVTVNGMPRESAIGQRKTLLRFLREDLALPGTKEGCAEGECGACTCYIDGRAVMACMIPALRAHGSQIMTVEGLQAQSDADQSELHPVQAAFMKTGAVQCGYCTPGFVMSGAKLLEEHPHPTAEQIDQSIAGNLCRCTGYYKIVDAIRLAAESRRVTDQAVESESAAD